MRDSLKYFLRNTQIRLLYLIREEEFDLQKDADFSRLIYLATVCGDLDMKVLSIRSGVALSTIYRWKNGSAFPKNFKTREQFIKLIETLLAEATATPRD